MPANGFAIEQRMSNEATDNTQSSFEEANAKGVVRKLQVFEVGSSQFGIFADEIATIAAWREPTPLPNAPKPVLGVVSIQGRMLTVLDLAMLAGGETDSNEAAQQLIALRGDEQLALAVNAVGETIELPAVAIEEAAGTLVLGVVHHDGVAINILNLKELFPTAIQGRERRRRRF
jgi:chemotaxis signal transduction protein